MCTGCKNHGTNQLFLVKGDTLPKREACLILGDIDDNTHCIKRNQILLNKKIKKIKK